MIWCIESSYGYDEFEGELLNAAKVLGEHVFNGGGHSMLIKKAYTYDEDDNEIHAPQETLRELEKLIRYEVEALKEDADEPSDREQHGTWSV